MLLEIPVSSFTKKILLRTEREPIRIDRFSILHTCFTDIRTGKPEKTGSVNLLNESLKFQLNNKKMPQSKQMYLYQSGLNLHRFYNHVFMNFIEGYVLAGKTASEGIRKYFEMYDIWDEDMDAESTLRQWQRYNSAKKNKKLYKKIDSKTAQKNTLKCQKIEPINLSIFHEEFSEFMFENLDLFMTKEKKFRYKLYNSIKIYMMYRILNYSAENLSRIFGLYIRNVYRNVSVVENLIKYDNEIGSKLKEFIS